MTQRPLRLVITSAGAPLGNVAYQYDLAGRQTRITWPDAFYAAYEYDVAGALTAVRENGAASGAGVLALYVYDNLSRRASLTRGNGVVTTYAYDSASRLDVLTHNLTGTGSDVTLDFAHNAAGQILSRDRSSANGAYVYPQPGMNVDAYASNGLNAPHFGHLQPTYERQSSAIFCQIEFGSECPLRYAFLPVELRPPQPKIQAQTTTPP